MWDSQHSSFPQRQSSSSSTTPFPETQSGLDSASSSGKGNSSGPLYSAQAPDSRLSQEGLNSSGDNRFYGSVNESRSDSTSNIQHSMPQYYSVLGANYNQFGQVGTTMQEGAPSNGATGRVPLQTCPADLVSALEGEGYGHNYPQHGYFDQDRSYNTSRQPNLRQHLSSDLSGPHLGPNSFNTSLCQPGTSLMGADTSDLIQKQPDVKLRILSGVDQNELSNFQFRSPRTNDGNGFNYVSSLLGGPFQLPVDRSRMTASNQNWNQKPLNTTKHLPGNIRDLTIAPLQSQIYTSEFPHHQQGWSFFDDGTHDACPICHPELAQRKKF